MDRMAQRTCDTRMASVIVPSKTGLLISYILSSCARWLRLAFDPENIPKRSSRMQRRMGQQQARLGRAASMTKAADYQNIMLTSLGLQRVQSAKGTGRIIIQLGLRIQRATA